MIRGALSVPEQEQIAGDTIRNDSGRDRETLLDDIRSMNVADADRERLVNEYLAR